MITYYRQGIMSEADKKNVSGSPDRFGYQWARYSTVLPESKEQLKRWLGSTTLESFKGKTVLDVGCGMGRNPYWIAKEGAKHVMAIDFDDESLAAARKNLSAFSNVEVRKISVYDLSASDIQTFDRVTCIGVLHHLSDPTEALQRMWSCVAPGGELILWCYAQAGNRLLVPLIQSIRAVGSRLPMIASRTFAKSLTLAAWPVIYFLPWKTEYYKNLKALSFNNVECIILDQMIPRISHYWTKQEMQNLLAPLKGELTLEFVQGNSWHARITKSLGTTVA